MDEGNFSVRVNRPGVTDNRPNITFSADAAVGGGGAGGGGGGGAGGGDGGGAAGGGVTRLELFIDDAFADRTSLGYFGYTGNPNGTPSWPFPSVDVIAGQDSDRIYAVISPATGVNRNLVWRALDPDYAVIASSNNDGATIRGIRTRTTPARFTVNSVSDPDIVLFFTVNVLPTVQIQSFTIQVATPTSAFPAFPLSTALPTGVNQGVGGGSDANPLVLTTMTTPAPGTNQGSFSVRLTGVGGARPANTGVHVRWDENFANPGISFHVSPTPWWVGNVAYVDVRLTATAGTALNNVQRNVRLLVYSDENFFHRHTVFLRVIQPLASISINPATLGPLTVGGAAQERNLIFTPGTAEVATIEWAAAPIGRLSVAPITVSGIPGVVGFRGVNVTGPLVATAGDAVHLVATVTDMFDNIRGARTTGNTIINAP